MPLRFRSLALVLLAASGCGDDAPPPVGDTTITVTHYDYTFDLATRRAHAKVTATFDAPGDCTTIAFRGTELDEASVLVDGAPPVSFEKRSKDLKICAIGRDAGAEIVIETDSTVALATIEDSQVGYSVREDATPAKNPLSYLVSWVGGCDKFGPCDSRPDKFATYTFHVTHAADLAVKCSGTITEDSPTQTSCDFALAGGPTYSAFGFIAYPKSAWSMVTDKGTWGAAAKVTIYDRADTTITQMIDAAYHQGFVAKMESLFGPYPFGDSLRVLIAPTYWAGFEHPGNIVLDDGLRAKAQIGGYSNPLAHTLDHEIAHQWAGDQTTIKDTYDFVWKESMAEYLAFVYEDETDHNVGLATVGYWKSASNGALYYPVPDEHPALFDYYGDSYGPGPMVLFRQIEAMFGRPAVLDALKMLLGHEHAISVADVIAALSATTHADLAAYYDAWVHGTGAPVYPKVAVTTTPTSLHVVQTIAPDRRCLFHIAVKGANPGEVLKVEVNTFANGIDQTIAIAPTFAITTTEVDSDRECLVSAASIAREAKPTRRNPWRTDHL